MFDLERQGTYAGGSVNKTCSWLARKAKEESKMIHRCLICAFGWRTEPFIYSREILELQYIWEN